MPEFEFPYFETDGTLDEDGKMTKKVIRVEADTDEEAVEKAVEALYGSG